MSTLRSRPDRPPAKTPVLGSELRARTGGQVLVDQLVVHGADSAFCVPGESYLAATDALYDRSDVIPLYVCRQEGGAATMAEAYGKLTGRPGICFVTRGPGATNASIAVHTAFQDSTPMILFIGQVSTGFMGREAFQELDYEKVFGSVAKWAVQIDAAARIPEILHRAFVTATSGRPGPVVIALPEDVLSAIVTVPDSAPYQPVRPSAADSDVDALGGYLRASSRPLLIVGGSTWDAKTAMAVTAFAERWSLPAITTFRRQDLIDNFSPSFAGALGTGVGSRLRDLVHDSDLLIVVGGRLGEMSTDGYSFVDTPRPRQQFVHVHPGVEELGRVYETDLAINADPREFVPRLALLEPPADLPWRSWQESARAWYLELSEPAALPTQTEAPTQAETSDQPPRLDLAHVVRHVSDTVPRNTVITNGAGNYTSWCHRYYRFSEYPSQLGPTNGAMGYGLPAAIAAKTLDRERLAIDFAGDGCLLMTGQELATTMQYDLRVIVIVVNNGHYGTIRLHQETRYPGRVIGTGLHNPDFVAFAESFGLHAERVTETDAFPAAFERARNAGRAALIELITDPEQATPDLLLSQARESGAAAQQNRERTNG